MSEEVQAESEFLKTLQNQFEDLERLKDDVMDLVVDGKPVCNTAEDAEVILRARTERLDHIKRLKDQLQEFSVAIKSEIRAEEWRLSNLDPFLEPLQSWARAQLAGAKRKSMVLKNGTVGFRKSSAGAETVDEEKLVKWAEVECPDAVKKSIWTSVVAEWEKKEGELAPGRKTKPAEDKFYTK